MSELERTEGNPQGLKLRGNWKPECHRASLLTAPRPGLSKGLVPSPECHATV